MSPELPQRKHPPHFAPIPRHNTPVVLFVTMAIQPRVNALANDTFHEAFKNALKEADAWRVFLYVIMPDHIHAFIVPRTVSPFPIGNWAKFLKRKIAQNIDAAAHGGRVSSPAAGWRWQLGCWDTQIRSREHLDEKASYVRMNPVRAGLCATPEEWKWQGEDEWIRW